MPATQSLEFSYTTGQTLTAKLFAVGSDTVAATASSVTEATNRKSLYVAAFTDVPAGDYLLVAFLGSTGVLTSDPFIYRLTLTTATFQSVLGNLPSAEQNATAVWEANLSGLGEAGDILVGQLTALQSVTTRLAVEEIVSGSIASTPDTNQITIPDASDVIVGDFVLINDTDRFRITAITSNTLTLDGDHGLSGAATFEITREIVRAQTVAELNADSVAADVIAGLYDRILNDPAKVISTFCPETLQLSLLEGNDYDSSTVAGVISIPIADKPQYEEGDQVFLSLLYGSGRKIQFEGEIVIDDDDKFAQFTGIRPDFNGAGKWELWHINNIEKQNKIMNGSLVVQEAIKQPVVEE